MVAGGIFFITATCSPAILGVVLVDEVAMGVELGKFDPPLWHAPYGRIV